MERELPSHKRDVLILALPKFCKSIINKKKEVFSSQIKYYALMSALIAALHIPGLSIAADLGVLVGVVRSYLFGFGLNKKSMGKPSSAKLLENLRAVMKSLYSENDVTKKIVVLLLRSLPLVLMCEAAEEGSIWSLCFGIPISFSFIYTFLSSALGSIFVDTENVQMKAFEIK